MPKKTQFHQKTFSHRPRPTSPPTHPLTLLFPILFSVLGLGLSFGASSIANYFGQSLNLNNLELNLLPVGMFIWFALAAIPVSKLEETLGPKKLILTALSVILLGNLALIFSNSFTSAFLAFTLLGLGIVIMEVIVNPLLNFIAPRGQGPSYLVARQLAQVIIAVALPYLLLWSQTHLGGWQNLGWIFFSLSALALFWFSFLKIPRVPQSQKTNFASILKIVRIPHLVTLALAMVIIGGFNNSLMIIIPRLLMERADTTFTLANLSNTVFFGARFLGELLGIFLLPHLNKWSYYRLMTTLGLLTMFALIFAQNQILIFILIGLSGCFYSTILYIIMSKILRLAGSLQQTASGLLVSSWSGVALFSLITGVITHQNNSQIAGLIFFALCALSTFILGLRFYRLFYQDND